MIISVFAASVSAVEYGEEYTNKPTKTYSQKFNDVPTSHWAFSYVGEMTERGVVSGYPNGNFYPDNNVTRAEFARIMTSASGLPISTPQTRDFSDVATDAWYAPYIHAAYPYLSGYQIYGGNYYKPDTPALREDIAVALVKLKGYDTLGADESILTTMFTDANSISSEARKYVAVALERGLVSGYEDNTFRGQDSISRAEATAMLWRAYQYGNDNKTFDNITPVQEVTPVPAITPAPTPINYERDDNDWKPSDESVTTPAPTYAATEKPIVTVEPTVAPTEKPLEKPYVMDTVTKAKISNTWNMMTSDNNNNIYYYDNDDNTVYKISMDSGKKTTVCDVSDLMMSETGEFDYDEETYGSDEADIVEYYKDFKVEQLYYDKTYDRLLLSGKFQKQTNWYGFEDKSVHECVIIEIQKDFKLFVKTTSNSVATIFNDGRMLSTNGHVVNPENGIKESSINLSYSEDYYQLYKQNNSDLYCYFNTYYSILKYDWSSNYWKRVVDFVDNGVTSYAAGLKGDTYYVWDARAGIIVKAQMNGKLTKLNIDTKNDIEIIDMKNAPSLTTGPSFDASPRQIGQILISDNESVFFYDEDTSSIRVIKER